MEKVYSILGVEVIVTDVDRVFIDEDGDRVELSDELGWWERDRNVVWAWCGEGMRSKLLVWGVVVHELVEMFLVKMLGLNKVKAHRIANVVESLITLGKAKLYRG